MNSQLINLKIETLQEEIEDLSEKLTILYKERQEKCSHVNVIEGTSVGPFTGAYSYIRLCTDCGRWGLDYYNTDNYRTLHPKKRDLDSNEVCDLRSKMNRFVLGDTA